MSGNVVVLRVIVVGGKAPKIPAFALSSLRYKGKVSGSFSWFCPAIR